MFGPAFVNCKDNRKLWEKVKEIEENYDPDASDLIKQIDATLMVNYGPEGRSHRGVIEVNEISTMSKLMKVLEWYENQLRKKEN